jgi:hypothetical protein
MDRVRNPSYSDSLDLLVEARSEACAVIDRSKTRITGSNPTQGMDVCLFCVCVALCRQKPCDGPTPLPRAGDLASYL